MSPELAHLTATMSTSKETPKAPDIVFKSKYGSVTILDLENYPKFQQTCKTVLLSAGLWNIVTGVTPRPDDDDSLAAREKWDEKAGRAMGIINSSVIESICDTFEQFITPNIDLPGLWDHLKSYDQTSDMLFVVNLRNRFDNFKFDPERVDIIEAVLELQKLKTLLSTIDKKIKDKDI